MSAAQDELAEILKKLQRFGRLSEDDARRMRELLRLLKGEKK